MKFFKITNLTTNEEHYISSTLPEETPTHVAMSAHLDPAHKYRVEEVTAKEFYGYPPRCIDLDVDDDWDSEDDGEYFD